MAISGNTPFNKVTGGNLVLMRHGQTAWALNSQYTGRSNIPLTEIGKDQAAKAKPFLKGYNFWDNLDSQVWVSPLKRAQQTAQIAIGNTYKTVDNLQEWDYGKLEGHFVPDINQLLGHTFNIWQEGVDIDVSSLPPVPQFFDQDGNEVKPAQLPGEKISDVAKRAQQVIDEVSPLLAEGKDILLVAHAHILRVLTCVYLGLDPAHGQNLVLDTASVSVLGVNSGNPALFKWNQVL
ncbi:MAG: histidine phosphatase family protein [Candidatus Ancillula sp.]|jgi:probable phosphoglycerate mutase|nr:histidine phosphatase family protein [Candidatus Ancillula sp.]